jgi:hypothetical protein
VSFIARQNLCTNPGLEYVLTGWAGAGTPAPTVAVSTARAHSGTHSLLITWAAGSSFIPNAYTALATTPGTHYTVSGWVYVPAGNPTVEVAVSGVGLAGFGATSSVNDMWQRLSVTFTATSSTHNVLFIAGGTPTAGQVAYLDDVLIETGSNLLPYFDGDSPGASWVGTPGSSVSQIVVASALPQLQFSVAFTGTRGGLTVSADPNDPTIVPIWTDLTKRLTHVGTKRGKSYELDQATAQEQTFTLRNTDGYLDPTNTASPFWPNVLPYRQCRLQVTIAGTTYTVFTGFIESWPQTWTLHGAYGWVTCLAVDAIAVLSQMILTSCLAAETLLDGPVGYWPLTEPNAATQGGQIAATGIPNLVQYQFGTGGTYQFGGTTLGALLGAGASDGTSGPITGNSTGLVLSPASGGNGIAFAAALGQQVNLVGYTISAWVMTTATSISLLSLFTNGSFVVAQMTVDASGNLTAGSLLTTISSTAKVNDGRLHQIALTVTAAGACLLYMDGVQVASGSTGSPVGYPDTLIIGATNYSSGTLGALTIGQVSVFNAVLTGSRIGVHRTAGATAFNGEDSGARFQRILNYGPWRGPVTIPAGNSNLQGCYALAGKSVAAALLDVVSAEQSNMYVDSSGTIVFENRHQRYMQLQIAWELGEGLGEQPYEGDVEVGFDPTQVFNVVLVQRPAGIIATARDNASVLSYFPRAFPTTPLVLPVTTDEVAIDAAQYLVGRYKDPHARVSVVTFRPSSNPALWQFCLTVTIGQRVALNRRPPNAPPIDLDLFVESVGHSYDAATGEWLTSIECSPSFWVDYEILTATRAPLNAPVAAGATSLVVNVPTDAAGNTPAQNGWTASAIPSIQIVDGSSTETPTVTAMSVAGQLVTLTVSALFYPHNAGAVVAENPGTYGYNDFDAAASLDSHSLGY